jgi:predicted RND superfamily exporter protein
LGEKREKEKTWGEREGNWSGLGLYVCVSLTLCTFAFVRAGFVYPAFFFYYTGGTVTVCSLKQDPINELRSIDRQFSRGRTFPYSIVLETPDGVFNNNKTFEIIDEMAAAMRSISYTATITGLRSQFANSVNNTLLEYCCAKERQGDTQCQVTEYHKYGVLYDWCANYISYDHRFILFDLTLNVYPWNNDGQGWLSRARAIQAELQQKYPAFLFYISRGAAIEIDLFELVLGSMGRLIGTGAAIVVAVLLLAFRSAILPLRTLVSLCMTLVCTYGLATLVYQYGIFDWMAFNGFASNEGMVWYAPILVFAVLVGLGLDYDVFLVARIFEARRNNMSSEDSIIFGVVKTGGVITAAGVIMILAFVGFLFSEIPVLNQMGFYLVFGVLLDTFFTRTMVVPALLKLLGDAHWWPRDISSDESAA